MRCDGMRWDAMGCDGMRFGEMYLGRRNKTLTKLFPPSPAEERNALRSTSAESAEHPVRRIGRDSVAPEDSAIRDEETDSATAATTGSTYTVARGRGRAPSEQDLQTRLQRIWKKLQVPTSQKLEYIMKYSS